ncbi:MAG: hypothetical protein KO316_09685 [Methanobacterium sp.]|nr:hypothetical protein [Methanobacterium sp.]
MGKYTIYDEEIVDSKIQSQLNVILEQLLKKIPNIQSVVLAGGFGRGEGSVIINGDDVQPLKDYDIFVFLDDLPSKKIINSLNENIYNELGIRNPSNDDFKFSEFVVDIQFRNRKFLEFLPDIATVDLKKASYLLFGESINESIPWNADDIPVTSGLRLLFEKMTGLIGHFSMEYITSGFDDKKRNFIIYECYKTYVEIATSLCILMGCYESSYKKRAEIFSKNFKEKLPDLHCKLPELPDLVIEATNFKLKPKFDKFDYNMLDFWDKTRKILLIVLSYYLENYTKLELDEISDYARPELLKIISDRYHRPYLNNFLHSNLKIRNQNVISIINHFSNLYLNYRYYKELKKEFGIIFFPQVCSIKSPIIKIYLTSPLILFSIKTDGTIEEKNFQKAREKMEELIPYLENKKLSWNNLRDAYILSYKLYYM